MPELLVDLGHLINGAVEHDRQACIAETAEEFLAFAEGVAEEHRHFVVIESFFAKTNQPFHHLFRGWKPIFRAAIGGLHN